MSHRAELVRVFELHDIIKNPDSPDSCFQNLEQQLENSTWMQKWRLIENELQGLENEAWNALKNDTQVKSYLTNWNPQERGRQQLLGNLVNPTRAYNYLKKLVAQAFILFHDLTKRVWILPIWKDH